MSFPALKPLKEEAPDLLPLSASRKQSPPRLPFPSPFNVSLKGWIQGIQVLPGQFLVSAPYSEISDHSLAWPILQCFECPPPSLPSPREP